MAQRDADVAVVGAGLAGLAAALRLAEAGLSVVLLEARERVGGRVLNLDLGDGRAVELGATWIGPTQDRMYALVEELGLETYPTYTDGESCLLLDGTRHRYAGDLPPLDPAVAADLARGMTELGELAAHVPLESPWEAERAGHWDGTSLADWLGERLETDGARRLLETYLGAVLVAEPEDLSLLHVLFYIRSGTDLDHLLDFEGGAQQDRIAGGSQLVATRLAERLGGAVELASPVTRIAQDGRGALVESGRVAVHAGSVVVAVPPALLRSIAFDPPLPPGRAALHERMRPGTVMKVLCFYDEPFWRGEGLNGFGITADHPAGFCVDYTPSEGEPGALAVFLWGRAADAARPLGAAGRRELVTGFLARLLGEPAAKPSDVHELDWAAEEWTEGCYAGFMPPGAWAAVGSALRPPVGRVHWAGSETSPVWMGYMEGAVRSGERAAAEILERRGSRGRYSS